MLCDPTLQGLRKLLVVEALAEVFEEELGGEDGRPNVREAIVQDAEEGGLHGGREAVVAQVVDEEDRDAGPLRDEGILLAGEGGLYGAQHELVGRDVGTRGLQLLAPGTEYVEGRAGLAGAARTAQPEPATCLARQGGGLGPGLAVRQERRHCDRQEERRYLRLETLADLQAVLFTGFSEPAAMAARRVVGPAAALRRTFDGRGGHKTFGRCRELNP